MVEILHAFRINENIKSVKQYVVAGSCNALYCQDTTDDACLETANITACSWILSAYISEPQAILANVYICVYVCIIYIYIYIHTSVTLHLRYEKSYTAT